MSNHPMSVAILQHELFPPETNTDRGIIAAHPWPDGSSEGFWQALEGYHSLRSVRRRNELATNPLERWFDSIDDPAQE
ncbi:hypothetical protein [Hyphomicrobium sp.]|uniref:hypothetical protein n=1 Tax=Hyphomicrobium sp. TaxID=82 RepID=UPI002E372FF8|nr:hypothetical protein [Hyphomicrobium sp.]HEX2841385.1 hypothetical protein [Hyphomicrobium sp.]